MLIPLAVTYVAFADRLPPRSGLKVARFVSGLPVPSDAQLLSFTDEWSGFNGDGFSEVRLQLTDEAFARMESRAREQRYEPITPTGLQRSQAPEMAPNARGLFRFRQDAKRSSDYELAVLDDSTKQLFVRLVVQ